jgi:hypothetical protein
MEEQSVIVHAHEIDIPKVIEEHAARGYVLVARTPPTIVAQAGFERLVFLPKDVAEQLNLLDKKEGSTATKRMANRIRALLLRPPIA